MLRYTFVLLLALVPSLSFAAVPLPLVHADCDDDNGDGFFDDGPVVNHTFEMPGEYEAVCTTTSIDGDMASSTVLVEVTENDLPLVEISAEPTDGIVPFTVDLAASVLGGDGELVYAWDFGDGSPRVTVQSDGNAVKHAPDGYAVTTHRFRKAGHHVIRVEHTNQHGLRAIGHLHVEVAE